MAHRAQPRFHILLAGVVCAFAAMDSIAQTSSRTQNDLTLQDRQRAGGVGVVRHLREHKQPSTVKQSERTARPIDNPGAHPTNERGPEPKASHSARHDPIDARLTIARNGFRGVRLAPGYELALDQPRIASVTLEYAGQSRGLRLASLPPVSAVRAAPAGSIVHAPWLGELDGEPQRVSEDDKARFEERAALLLHPHKPGLMLDTTNRDWGVRWVLSDTLHDSQAGADAMPEIIVVFATSRDDAGVAIEIEPATTSESERSQSLPARVVLLKDAQPTLPEMQLPVIDERGVPSGEAPVRAVAIDLSALGATSVHALRIRPVRGDDLLVSGDDTGKPIGRDVPWAPCKVLLVRTQGLPVPEWVAGD